MPTPEKPLRILAVVNLAWDWRLGASRVWLELAEQWRAAGHTVEKFTIEDAFPNPRPSRFLFALRQVLFSYKAAAFVKKNGRRFDVVDALIGTLPFSKRKLDFRGLLVARSVGLYRLYERFELDSAHRRPPRLRGTLAGRIYYRLLRLRTLHDSDRAVRHADLINVPNEAEAACLRAEMGAGLRIAVQPYGLTDERSRAFAEAAAAPELRLAAQRVVFIGMWAPRKGAQDWAAIIAAVRQQVPGAQFRFIGTMADVRVVQSDLGAAASPDMEFISEYEPDDLAGLLTECTVGAFPSYVEGFGLAVLEQLATGIPTVAYDTAGPRDMLNPNLSHLLTPSGDTASFAAALVRVLRLDLLAYGELSRESVKAAARFSWRRIADETITTYRSFLNG